MNQITLRDNDSKVECGDIKHFQFNYPLRCWGGEFVMFVIDKSNLTRMTGMIKTYNKKTSEYQNNR